MDRVLHRRPNDGTDCSYLGINQWGQRSETMDDVETRQANRDSMFLLARVRVDGEDVSHRAKVRNLSAGGMMAECDAAVSRGTLVSVELRNVGWVEGSVAWTQNNRFGIAFVDAIDPAIVRDSSATTTERSDEVRRFSPVIPASTTKGKLRKI